MELPMHHVTQDKVALGQFGDKETGGAVTRIRVGPGDDHRPLTVRGRTVGRDLQMALAHQVGVVDFLQHRALHDPGIAVARIAVPNALQVCLMLYGVQGMKKKKSYKSLF